LPLPGEATVTVQMMLERTGLSKGTYARVEAGEATVAIGAYAMCLLTLGHAQALGDLLDEAKDDVGLLLDKERLPKRVASGKRRCRHERRRRRHLDDEATRVGTLRFAAATAIREVGHFRIRGRLLKHPEKFEIDPGCRWWAVPFRPSLPPLSSSVVSPTRSQTAGPRR